MTKYLNNSILVDLVVTVIVCTLLFYFKSKIEINLNLTTENILGISKTLIGISSTLIGFLLTVITLIVTLKKSHESAVDVKEEIKDYSKPPTESVFDKKISKSDQFYGTDISKHVVKLLLYASYELAFVTIILLAIQLINNYLSFPYLIILLVFCLSLTTMAVVRSLIIFHFYIKIHLPNN